MSFKRQLISLIFLLFISTSIFGQLNPHDIIPQMQRGINMGNTLEPPTEGGWNNGPAREYYFEDYRIAGFKTVRIPVRWEKHTSETAPYTVDDSWLNRVEQIVDWALNQKLFVIMNAHHEDWFYADYNLHKARFDSIWSQIATRFQNKSDSLFFELVNEPTVEGDVGLSVDELDELNVQLISIIRKTNPTRIIIFCGNSWSNLEQLQLTAIPDDDYLMAYYHSYDPYEFGILGTKDLSDADITNIRTKFHNAGQWSKENNIPLIISEFGAPYNCDYNQRMLFYSVYVEEAIKNGLAFQAWDDGGNFRIYKRASRQWEDMKDILIYYSPEGPASLKCTPKDSAMTISWMNRTNKNDSIIVQRKTASNEFVSIATLSADAINFTDTQLAPGDYYYRVIATFADTTDIYSYPIMSTVKPSARSPFHGSAFQIPGKIEVEEFDIGGEGLTYHDIDAANQGNASNFRSSGVDIETCSDTDGGYNIGYIETGEWLEYTVNFAADGEYEFEARVASENTTGKFDLKIDGNVVLRSVAIENTGGWQSWSTIDATTRNISAGEHTMRIDIKGGGFNLNWIKFTQATAIDDNSEKPVEFSLQQNYPNPFNPTTMIRYQLPKSSIVQLEVFNMLGEKVSTLVSENQPEGNYSFNWDGSGLASGIYLYQLSAGNLVFTKKMLLFK